MPQDDLSDLDPQRAAMAQFDAWLEVPDVERTPWLAALAQRDALVHARVQRLIEADREADARAFLDAPDALGELSPRVATLAGTRLGPWQLDRVIGTGGMGQVWLARRTDGRYEGLAAIKLLRLAVADAGANARFAREGQLLGRLNHPNIARLLDAGATESGERYLVLEHVDGERIDHYCDGHRLGVAQRIALFIVVCEAVAHAHENLVVHRDLKPSNIFVDRTGQVKLLDFGVAKLLDDESAEAGAASELTRAAGAAMTPEYASPEQLSGGTVTTATDVYGLGLVLYGLLSGLRPFGAESTPAARPPSPLTDAPRALWAAHTEPAMAQRIADERATSVAGLRKSLHGDIAVVIGKAIKADAAERYRSVPDFADDLQRTLDQRPIAARPDSALYRGAKFVRRHAFGVGAAALIVLAVVGGVAGTLIKQHEAEREAERAVAVKRFLLDLFGQARGAVKAEGTHSREATLDDMLVAGAARVETSLASQPAVRDEVFDILIELYSETGDPAVILSLARRRLAAAQSAFGPEDARVAPAEVLLAATLLNAYELPETDKLLAHAQTLLDRAGDRNSIERARLLRWQGLVLFVKGIKPPWAEHPLRQAIVLMRERYPEGDNLVSALATLPALACSYGRPAEAVEATDELLRRSIENFGSDNLHVDQANLARGQLMVKAGRAADAIAPMQQALDGFQRHMGEQSADTVQSHLQLAKAYLAAGRTDDSQREFEIGRNAVEHEHADDKQMAENLADVSADLDKIRSGKPPICGPTRLP